MEPTYRCTRLKLTTSQQKTYGGAPPVVIVRSDRGGNGVLPCIRQNGHLGGLIVENFARNSAQNALGHLTDVYLGPEMVWHISDNSTAEGKQLSVEEALVRRIHQVMGRGFDEDHQFGPILASMALAHSGDIDPVKRELQVQLASSAGFRDVRGKYNPPSTRARLVAAWVRLLDRNRRVHLTGHKAVRRQKRMDDYAKIISQAVFEFDHDVIVNRLLSHQDAETLSWLAQLEWLPYCLDVANAWYRRRDPDSVARLKDALEVIPPVYGAIMDTLRVFLDQDMTVAMMQLEADDTADAMQLAISDCLNLLPLLDLGGDYSDWTELLRQQLRLVHDLATERRFRREIKPALRGVKFVLRHRIVRGQPAEPRWHVWPETLLQHAPSWGPLQLLAPELDMSERF